MKKVMLIIIFILHGIIFFNACKKEKDPEEPEYDTETSQDNSLAEGTFNDVNNIANQAIENHSLSTYKIPNSQSSILNSCAALSVNINSGGGGTIAVDFGNENCLCMDGRYRRGIINIAFTGSYRDSGTQIVTTFNNYFVGKDSTNMFQVTGSKTVTNNGHNSAGHLNFSVSVDGHLINSSGVTMNWTSSRNREWISGYNTPLIWSDDEYIITGSAGGTNFQGKSFTALITNGLHFQSCRWITQGTFELTPTGKPTRTFDYGNGNCDNLATLAVNGHSFNITLR